MREKANNQASRLEKWIRGIVNEIITIRFNNRPRMWIGVATSVSGVVPNQVVSVQLIEDDAQIITNLKSKTHETVGVGDEVYLKSPVNSLTNVWVDCKK